MNGTAASHRQTSDFREDYDAQGLRVKDADGTFSMTFTTTENYIRQQLLHLGQDD